MLVVGILAGSIATYAIAAPSIGLVATSISTTKETTTSTLEKNSTITFTTSVLAGSNLPLLCNAQQEVWGPGYGFPSEDLPVNASFPVPVLLMQPNTTGYFCVVYVDPHPNYNVSLAQELASGFEISYGDCGYDQGGIGCAFHLSHSFATTGTILNSTGAFVSNATSHYVSVIYSIRPLPNSTGFYDEAAPLPHYPCWSAPMAVGYLASEVNASDFFGYFPNPPFCGGGGNFTPVEFGVVGIQVMQLDWPARW